jgi:hypothetical protein
VKKLFIAWQDPSSRLWFPVGMLTVEENIYRFQYINGAREALTDSDFEPFGVFPDLDRTYESTTLFPIFSKRVLSPSRPDYMDFVSWLGLSGPEVDPVEMLARSGGQSVTDRFEIFPYPEKIDENQYHCHFFVHGLRHLPKETIERINRLKKEERLYLANEFQNPYDRRALILCTEDHWHVGYCPRYLLHDVDDIAAKPEKVTIKVEKDVTPTSPLQFRLLCGLTATWDESELPFNKPRYQPIEGIIQKSPKYSIDIHFFAGIDE